MASYEDSFVTYKGDMVKGFSTIYPLYKGSELVGVAYAAKLFDKNYGKEFIRVQYDTGIRSRKREQYSLDDIVTSDPAMIKLKNKIQKVSDFDSIVLIEEKPVPEKSWLLSPCIIQASAVTNRLSH